MLKNHLKLAIRNLLRNRAYSVINILGLSVGIASCILILLYVQDELSYDRYHDHSDRIFRIYRDLQLEDRSMQTLATSNLLGPTMAEELPEVEASMRLSKRFPEVMVANGNSKFYEQKFFFSDPSIFEVFDFHLTDGNMETALNRPFTVVISEEMAKKYFGDKDPMGENLVIRGSWGADDYEVTGVMENTPHNSHLSIHFLTSFETLRAKTPNSDTNFENWRHIGSYTYVLLQQGVNPEELGAKMSAFIVRHQGERAGSILSYKFQPITDIHLYSDFEREIEPNSDIRYLYIFGSIAFIILLVASINYINLATAKSFERAKEVGVRKTLGADKIVLVKQFLSESAIYILLAILISFLWVETSLPLFNSLINKPLAFDPFSLQFTGMVVLIVILVGLLAGFYPALVSSRLKPDQIFKEADSGKNKSMLRNTLIVFQFSVSIILIASTFIVMGQMDHIRDKRLGISDDVLVSISTGPGVEFRQNYSAFKDALLNIAGIESVTFLNPSLPATTEHDLSLKPEGFEESINVNVISVGDDFLNTLEVPVVQGFNLFDPGTDTAEDSLSESYIPVLVNETAVREWGWDEPLGKTFDGFSPGFRVTGVVQDFHYSSLKERLAPLLIYPGNYSVNHVLVRLKSQNLSENISFLEDTWADIGPGTPFTYTFVDDQYDSLYRYEDRLAGVFKLFTSLAIIIACLGLFGLAAFSAERRSKEIGIRKILGASVANIVKLLTADFLKPVIIGLILAIPITLYVMNIWLTDFAYRIEIGPGIFLAAGLLTILLSLLTISWQAVKSALINPANTLRNE
jgi:putative ABC transport system permease protein